MNITYRHPRPEFNCKFCKRVLKGDQMEDGTYMFFHDDDAYHPYDEPFEAPLDKSPVSYEQVQN